MHINELISIIIHMILSSSKSVMGLSLCLNKNNFSSHTHSYNNVLSSHFHSHVYVFKMFQNCTFYVFWSTSQTSLHGFYIVLQTVLLYFHNAQQNSWRLACDVDQIDCWMCKKSHFLHKMVNVTYFMAESRTSRTYWYWLIVYFWKLEI